MSEEDDRPDRPIRPKSLKLLMLVADIDAPGLAEYLTKVGHPTSTSSVYNWLSGVSSPRASAVEYLAAIATLVCAPSPEYLGRKLALVLAP
jgi:hypothetical protein